MADRREPVSQAQALLLACLSVSLLNTAIILSSPGAPFRVRALLALFDFGHQVALGVAGYWLFRALATRQHIALGVVTVLAAVAGFAWLAPDFANFSVRHDHPELRVPLGIAAAFSVPLAGIAGRYCQRLALRLGALTISLVVAVSNHFILQADYPGIHLLLSWNALALAAGALTGARPLSALSSALALLGPRPRTLVATALAISAALLSLIVQPPTNVLVLAFRTEGVVLFPFLVPMHGEATFNAAPTMLRNEWIAPAYMRRREGLPELAPSEPTLAPPDPLVVFVTVDAMRAELVQRDPWRQRLPHFQELAREAVEFTQARSPACTTRNGLGQVFSSRYASQLHWHRKGRYASLSRDRTPRLTDRLRAAKFKTLQVRVLPTIASATRIIGRFDKDKYLTNARKGQAYVLSDVVVKEALRQLRAQASGPTFLYMHWLDAHDPYTAAGKEGSDFERYVREVEIVDRSLGELIESLKKEGLWQRTILVVSADHGEGLDDHGIPHHGGSVYESLVRVPLFIRAPGVPARRVDVPVTTLDIAPTLLDLLGQRIPGEYMGQSLVGFLRGKDPHLTRPIAFDEGRISVYGLLAWPYKVIERRNKHTVEIYDLTTDPTESENLYGLLPGGKDDQLLAVLRAFFAAHDVKSTLEGED